jgi:hypothetical protein
LLLIGIAITAGWVVFRQLARAEWVYGTYYGKLWDENRYQVKPRLPVPGQRLPRMIPLLPFGTREGAWVGFFGPFRVLGGVFLCLGIPAVMLVGLVIYLLSRKSPPTSPVQPPAVRQSNAETDLRACPGCSRQVQADWNHCPYCGRTLSAGNNIAV